MKREKGDIRLTPEGREILKYAAKTVKIADELEKRIKNMQKETKPYINIGTTPVYSRVIMPTLLGGLQKAFPQVKIKLDTGSSEIMENTLFSGNNDIVIVANPKMSKKLHAFPFLKEELVVICAKKEPLRFKGDALSLQDIKDYPLIMREEGSATRKVVLSALRSLRITPSVLIEATNTEFIKEWVAQGKGISILVKRAIFEHEKQYLNMIPLTPPLFLEISMLVLKSMRYNIWIQKFIEHLKNSSTNPFLQR